MHAIARWTDHYWATVRLECANCPADVSEAEREEALEVSTAEAREEIEQKRPQVTAKSKEPLGNISLTQRSLHGAEHLVELWQRRHLICQAA